MTTITKYRSTEEVTAIKLGNVTVNPDYTASLTNEDGDVTVIVGADYVTRERPKVGGYYMKTRDGFEAFIESDLFEASFSKV